jgi:hypothetical protein
MSVRHEELRMIERSAHTLRLPVQKKYQSAKEMSIGVRRATNIREVWTFTWTCGNAVLPRARTPAIK